VADAVKIPAEQLTGGQLPPDCCARHGLPAARRVDFVVKSRPKVSSVKRLAVPGYTAVDRAAEYLTKVQFIRVEGWPLCRKCLRRRTAGLAVAALLFFGGITAMIASAAISLSSSPANRALAIPFMLGFAAVVASPWPFAWGGLPKITRAEATPDGSAVLVEQPASGFRAQVRHPKSAREVHAPDSP
jgi:hypothetical protein